MATLSIDTLTSAIGLLMARSATPLLLVDAQARVLAANESATSRLTHEDADVVRDAIDGDHSVFEAVRLRGSERTWLLVGPVGHAAPSRVERARRAAVGWRLTKRQRDVLALVVRGDANKEIAEALALSVATVEAHVTALLLASGADSRARLIALVGDLAEAPARPGRGGRSSAATLEAPRAPDRRRPRAAR